ncbi:MAG: hypothetical protein OXC44_04985 [Proteobacteria bacterium]|nr:hypothetical protein [Pseudomonadota bacterium]
MMGWINDVINHGLSQHEPFPVPSLVNLTFKQGLKVASEYVSHLEVIANEGISFGEFL